MNRKDAIAWLKDMLFQLDATLCKATRPGKFNITHVQAVETAIELLHNYGIAQSILSDEV